MNGSAKKLAVIGLAGVTAVTSLPINTTAFAGDIVGVNHRINLSTYSLSRVSVSCSMEGKYFIKERVLYANELLGKLEVTVNDTGAGDSVEVNSIKIEKPGESVSVSEGKFNILDLDDGLVDYNVIVQLSDGSEESEKLTVVAPELALVDRVEKDSVPPELSYREFTGMATKDDILYANGNLVFNVSDDIALDESAFEVMLGDMKLESSFSDGLLSVPITQLEDGKHTITVKAEDMCGNNKSISKSVDIQRSAPEIQGKSHSSVITNGGVSYTKSEIVIRLDGCEDTKIKSVSVLKDGKVVSDNIAENAYFRVNASGVYTVRVTDIADNVTTYRLEDLFDDICSSIVVDTTLPVGEIKVNGKDVQSSWYVDDAVLELAGSDDVCLDYASISVNGDTVREGCNGSSTFNRILELGKDFPKSSNGVYSVVYTLVDIVGNQSTVERVIKLDKDAPTISNGALAGKYFSEDGKFYLPGSTRVNALVEDAESGVKALNVFKNGELVSDKLPYEISESGSYTFKALDNVGHVTKEYTLGEILGEEESISEVIIDEERPVITTISGFDAIVSGGKDWYTESPSFVFRVTDDNLKSVECFYNNDTWTPIKNEEDGTYEIRVPKTEGEVNIGVVATDKAGNTSRFNYGCSVDTKAPEGVKATINAKGIEHYGKVYFTSKPTVIVSASDTGSGIKNYYLNSNKNTSGIFEIGAGTYNVSVEDNIGNKSVEKSLGELLGWKGNTVVIDNAAPKIDFKRPKGAYRDYFGDDVTYVGKVTDNQGIYSASMKINGKTVHSFTSQSDGVLSHIIEGSTGDAKANDDGSYDIVVSVVDNSGNKSEWSDKIYIDRDAPKIEKFVFQGTGNKEGSEISGKNRYGFFFRGGVSCDIHVSDGEISSGIRNVTVMMHGVDGRNYTRELDVKGGVAELKFPKNWKGMIEAYSVDNVGHQGKTDNPDGIVSEDSNSHSNNVKIGIKLPAVDNKDRVGRNLYADDLVATALVGCGMSGVKKLEWGVDSELKGSIGVTLAGRMSGDIASVKEKDKNLLVDLSKAMRINGNKNGMRVWVKMQDRAGHESRASRYVSIDKDRPKVDVSFNQTNGSNYYDSVRTAIIRINERNFSADKVELRGNYGRASGWSKDGENWIKTLTFEKDDDYQFSVSCTDLAGNRSNTYKSEKFTVDRTNPVVKVSWNNSSAENGNFYKKARTATITIKEHNFDPAKVSFKGDGSIGRWSTNGDIHTASVSFNKDGEYSFSVSCTDKAGNKSNVYKEDKFIIDTSGPSLKVSGVQKGISYKKSIGFTVSVADKYIDKNRTKVSLLGRKNGKLTVSKSLSDRKGIFSFDGFPKGKKYDDLYMLHAVVYDKAGNKEEVSIPFTLNRFGSKFTFLSEELLGNYINTPEDVEIREENIDRLKMSAARVVVLKDGVEIDVPEDMIDITESGGEKEAYNYVYSVNRNAFTEDGKYQVQVYSRAKEGTKYSSISEEYAFVLDSQKPEVIVSGVESGKMYKEYSKTVSLDIKDTSGVKDVSVMVNGESITPDRSDGIYTFAVQEGKGAQEVNIEVTDLAGNTTVEKISDFYITSNPITYLLHQLWFKVICGIGLALIGLLTALFIKRRRINKRKEDELLKEQEELYRTTTSSSLGTDSNGTLDESSKLDE